MLRAFLLATLLIAVTTSADDESRSVVLLPAYVIQIPESIQNVLIAETDTSTMYRYTTAEDGVGNPDARYMSIGQNGVGKQRSGDRRTPLGIYFVTEQLDTSRMHEKYGATAFPLDYPNIWDKM